MPLIIDREAVLSIYKEAAELRWVIPTFCAENLTTLEAVLSATKEYGESIGKNDLPITLAITNLYPHRAQSLNYTHSGDWELGLRLFLADINTLTSTKSPYKELRVMVHLDHIQPDSDSDLLEWDLSNFSSIMFDASTKPFAENIQLTKAFVEANRSKIVIEGACDEIVDATGMEKSELTTPERAKEFVEETSVDFIVANLGTEHRASAAELKYHGNIAKSIKSEIGSKIVLHGCSSVPNEQVKSLFDDGVCKVNIWTTLERDSSPILFREMVKNAAKVAGPDEASAMLRECLLGEKADTSSKADLGYYTTVFRQSLVFKKMKEIVKSYLELWYV